MNFKHMTLAALIAAATATGSAQASETRSVENLERERATLVDVMTDPSLSAAERAQKIDVAKRRLLDLERIVVRDGRLTGSRASVVRKAFSDYDLTFLVNASAAEQRHVTEFWLHQLGITTASLSDARVGRR